MIKTTNIKDGSLLGYNTGYSIDFIKNLYFEEKLPIFEQNHYHVFSYLLYQSKLTAVIKDGWEAVGVDRENESFLFTPVIYDINSFINDLRTLYTANHPIRVVNVSEDWTTKYLDTLQSSFKSVELIPRSKEEAVYSTETLTTLAGKDFAVFRSTRNKLINTGLVSFEKVNKTNLSEALELIDTWNRVQGYKYNKNKQEKEKSVITLMSEWAVYENNLRVELAKINNKTLAVMIYFSIPGKPEWGEIYMVKGINRTEDGGVHGISDACYLHIFNELKNMGCIKMNDGELGSEIGTREHKLRFKPITFLKSFDLNITP